MRQIIKFAMLLAFLVVVFTSTDMTAFAKDNVDEQGVNAKGVDQKNYNAATDVALCGYVTKNSKGKEITVTIFWQNIERKYYVMSGGTISSKHDKLGGVFKDHSKSNYSYSTKNFKCPTGVKYNKKDDYEFSNDNNSELKYDIFNEMENYPNKVKKWFNEQDCMDLVQKYNNLAGYLESKDYDYNPNIEQRFHIMISGGIDVTNSNGDKVQILPMLADTYQKAQKKISDIVEKKFDSCEKTYDEVCKDNTEEACDAIKKRVSEAKAQVDPESKNIDSRLTENKIFILESPINNPDGTCSGMFGEKVTEDLNTALKYIQYIGPILVIVLGILDFIKAVASGSSETFNGAWKKLLKRLIIAVLLFFIVVLLKFVFRIFGILAPTDCFK